MIQQNHSSKIFLMSDQAACSADGAVNTKSCFDCDAILVTASTAVNTQPIACRSDTGAVQQDADALGQIT